jgi:hypothetical protein
MHNEPTWHFLCTKSSDSLPRDTDLWIVESWNPDFIPHLASSRSSDTMANAWSFLHPWREALVGYLRLEPNGDLEERGVLASFECWPDATKQYQKFITAEKCFLHVEFPTDPSERSNRQRLQRVREAVELFDRLAAVDNAAFESLLSEFLIYRSPRRTGTARRPHVVWPTWEFQLTGPLPPGDATESQSAVTWGQLLGCPDDPWKTSSAFRSAMGTLKATALGTGGNRHNFFVSAFWQVHGHEMLLEGSQKLVSPMQRVRPKPLSREVHNLLELNAPPVAHVLAVGRKAALIRTWQKPAQRGNKTRVKSEEIAALPAIFLQRRLPEMAAAMAQADATTLKLELSDWGEDATALANSRVDTGFLLSTLVSGRSLCAAARSFPPCKRSGKITAWDVQWSRTSSLRIAAVLSAFAEAKATKTLTLSPAEGDDGIYSEPAYWKWVAYAFWSRSARSSIQNLTIVWINLTEAHVAAVRKVLASGFPEPAETPSASGSAYGYVDIGKGTELRLPGLEGEDDAALTLTADCRCRAFYDSNGVADVVVPGYGVCKVELAENATFVHGVLGHARTGSGCGIRSLHLTLSTIENGRVLPQLLKLVGKGLHSLSLDSGGIEDGSLSLGTVASACPQLKELRTRDWNVVLGGDCEGEALQTWGIKRLSMRGSGAVDGLAWCLRDPDYRMSSELVELDICPSRFHRWNPPIYYDDEYVASLMEVHGEALPVVKKKMNKSSKCAVISVVSGGGGAVQYLDSSILSIIFTFAATPQCRSVQVTQYPTVNTGIFVGFVLL